MARYYYALSLPAGEPARLAAPKKRNAPRFRADRRTARHFARWRPARLLPYSDTLVWVPTPLQHAALRLDPKERFTRRLRSVALMARGFLRGTRENSLRTAV